MSTEHSDQYNAHDPTVDPAALDEPESGIALCLSGGGYRAMLFHVGVLWRLNEVGILQELKRVSSVSGGSITAGVLGMNWNRLSFNSADRARTFQSVVVEPIRKLAARTIDANAIVLGKLVPGTTVADRVATAYRKHLFGNATLQDLPDDAHGPRFVINATNVQSGVLWRFEKPYMRDYRVGKVPSPTTPLAVAVTASSAFPPFLSPMRLRLQDADFTPCSGSDLQRSPFTTDPMLTDGGVYDNLGLEAAWKSYRTVLVSDAGGKMASQEKPSRKWTCHAIRVLDVVDNQVRSLRKRHLIDSFKSNTRLGAYWGIRTNIADYQLADTLPCPYDKTIKLAGVPTRLRSMPAELQERLINWGYSVCDAAIRKHVDSKIPAPSGFPYPHRCV